MVLKKLSEEFEAGIKFSRSDSTHGKGVEPGELELGRGWK